jgi:hypothetical protein
MASKGNIIQRILRLVFDKEAAQKADRASKQAVGGIDRALGGLKKAALTAGAAIAAAFAFRKIIAGVKELGRAFIEQEAIWNRLAGTLASVGVQFADVEGGIRAAARAMQDTTTIGDEQFAETLQQLVVISGDYEGSLRNVSAVADLAAGLQIDLATAAKLVGRAMAGQTQMLSRYGIVVEKGADAVETMRRNFKGLAENEGRSLAGLLKRLSNEWGDFKEALGDVLITASNGRSILENLIDLVKGWTIWIEEHKTQIVEAWGSIFDGIRDRWNRFLSGYLRGQELALRVNLLLAKVGAALTLGYELRTERLQNVVDLENELLGIQKERANVEARLGRGSGTGSMPPAWRPIGTPRPPLDPETDELKAQKEEIANLVQLAKLGLLKREEEDRLLAIERELNAEFERGIASLERRLEIATQLRSIESETVNIRRSRRPPDIEQIPDIGGLARIPKPEFGTFRLSKTEEAAIEYRRELQREAATEFIDQMQRMEQAALQTASIASDAFSAFFEALLTDSQNAGGALVAVLLEGLARYFEVRATGAFAEGLLGNPSGFAAGIAFSAAAGAARALEASLGARRSGSSSAGALSGGSSGIGSSRSTTQPQPEITLVLQGDFDALNPKFVRAIYTATHEGIQTIGTGNVRVHTMPRGSY